MSFNHCIFISLILASSSCQTAFWGHDRLWECPTVLSCLSISLRAASCLGFCLLALQSSDTATLRWESSQIRILLWHVQQLLSTVFKLFLVHDTEKTRAMSHLRILRSLVCVCVVVSQTKQLPCLLNAGCMMVFDCMLTFMVPLIAFTLGEILKKYSLSLACRESTGQTLIQIAIWHHRAE